MNNDSSIDSAYVQEGELSSSLKIAVILVTFSDVAYTHEKEVIEDKFFAASNSLTDYYDEVSYSSLTITGDVTNWLPLSNTKSFYGNDSDNGIDDYHSARSQIVTDAFDAADLYVDFSAYDDFFIVHVGENQYLSGDQYDTWSHSYVPDDGLTWNYDGVTIDKVSIVAELEEFGIYCREFGRQNNLPYLNDSHGVYNYVDDWALMDSGAWNGNDGDSPAQLTGYSRKFFGFINDSQIRVIEDETILITNLSTIEQATEENLLIKLPLQDSKHYYLIEAREQTGYDTALPGQGVLIYKVDETKSSGAGIVKLMDSRDSTSTKNDADFDTPSSEAVSVFKDELNEIMVIISSETGSVYEVLVDRYTDLAYTENTITPLQDYVYDLGTLEKTQEIAWEIDRVSGGSLNFDFWIELVSGSDYELVEDVNYDCGAFIVPETGNYRLHVQNPDAFFDLTYSIMFNSYNKTDMEFLSVSRSLPTIYTNGIVEYSVEIRNNGTSTAMGITMEAKLPSQISFAPGQGSSYLIESLGFHETHTATWSLIPTQVGGPYQIDFNVSTSEDEWHYFELAPISTDLDQPDIILSEYPDGYLTNDTSISVNWTADDDETGVKELHAFLNETMLETIDNSTSEYGFTSLSDGIWNLTIEAEDNSGNKMNGSTIVQIDSTVPDWVNCMPTGLWISPYSLITLDMRCNDAETGIKSISLQARNASGQWKEVSNLNESGEFQYSLVLGDISGSTYEMRTIVEDLAGNKNQSDTIVFNVDKSEPAFQDYFLSSSSTDEAYYSGTLRVQIYVDDEDSGLDEVRVKLLCNGDTMEGLAEQDGDAYLCNFDLSSIQSTAQAELVIIVTDKADNDFETSVFLQLNGAGGNNGSNLILDLLPLIIGAAILAVGIGLSIQVIRIRRNPYKMINRLDKKKEKFLNKSYALRDKKVSKEKSEETKREIEEKAEEISKEEDEEDEIRKPYGFRYLEATDVAYDLPEAERFEFVSEIDIKYKKRFFKNVERKNKEDLA